MGRRSKSMITTVTDYVFERMRHAQSRTVVGSAPTTGFESFIGHKYALLISFRKDGRAVPSPVWFGRDEQDRIYFHTETAASKVRRIQANPNVLVAPCDFRGKPLGPPAEGRARVLEPSECGIAERTIAANYRSGRKIYAGLAARLDVPTSYVEILPRKLARSSDAQ